MKIDLQMSPAMGTWDQLRDAVVAAEAAGFDTTWVFDHFMGEMISGGSMLEPFALLGALAASTTRIGLGSLVLNIVNRHPGVIASGSATIQALSAGRFVLGLGAGASPTSRWGLEHRVLGIPLAPTVAQRHQNLITTLDELDRLWAPDRDDELATFPLPDPRPPVVIGVNGVALATIAGSRCDGLNVRASHPDLEPILIAAQEARAAAGRDPAPWDASVWTMWDESLLDPAHLERVRWEQLGVSRLVLVVLDTLAPLVKTIRSLRIEGEP